MGDTYVSVIEKLSSNRWRETFTSRTTRIPVVNIYNVLRDEGRFLELISSDKSAILRIHSDGVVYLHNNSMPSQLFKKIYEGNWVHPISSNKAADRMALTPTARLIRAEILASDQCEWVRDVWTVNNDNRRLFLQVDPLSFATADNKDSLLSSIAMILALRLGHENVVIAIVNLDRKNIAERVFKVDLAEGAKVISEADKNALENRDVSTRSQSQIDRLEAYREQVKDIVLFRD